MHYFSPSTGGFYCDELHGKIELEVDGPPNEAGEPTTVLRTIREPIVPSDAVACTEEEWRALVDARKGEQKILVKKGKLVLEG